MGFPAEQTSVILNGVPPERVRVREDPASLRVRCGWQDRAILAWAGRAESAQTLAKKDLGFAPSVTLEDGIRAEHEWLSAAHS